MRQLERRHARVHRDHDAARQAGGEHRRDARDPVLADDHDATAGCDPAIADVLGDIFHQLEQLREGHSRTAGGLEGDRVLGDGRAVEQDVDDALSPPDVGRLDGTGEYSGHAARRFACRSMMACASRMMPSISSLTVGTSEMRPATMPQDQPPASISPPYMTRG